MLRTLTVDTTGYRPLTKQRSCLMESEGSEGEEAARARRGPLFTDENLSMGG